MEQFLKKKVGEALEGFVSSRTKKLQDEISQLKELLDEKDSQLSDLKKHFDNMGIFSFLYMRVKKRWQKFSS